MCRRFGLPEEHILMVQGNFASTYASLGQAEKALRIEKDVYSGHLRLKGEEHEETFAAANNYAYSLVQLQRFDEAKLVLRKEIPVARRVLGESDDLTLTMRWNYATALYSDSAATLDDLREAVETLEDSGRIARRVLCGAHPTTVGIERELRNARDILRARETPSPR